MYNGYPLRFSKSQFSLGQKPMNMFKNKLSPYAKTSDFHFENSIEKPLTFS
jgi:hypothetical protein